MYEQTDPDLFEGGPVVAEAEAPAPEVAIEPAVTAAEMVNVTVTTPGGTSATSAAHKYTYIPAPTVTALDVTFGPGAGGNTVVITGINLSGATAVKFGAVSADFTVDSATQITATVPAAIEPATGAEAPAESEAEVETEAPEAVAAQDQAAQEAGAEG